MRQQQQLYNKFQHVGPTNLLGQQIVGNLLYVVLYGFFRTVVCCMLLLGFFYTLIGFWKIYVYKNEQSNMEYSAFYENR